jgi:glycosyltransferase involved in cell wall biosynthesis
MRLGIIVPADFVQRQPFGGAAGFIENIAGGLGMPVTIFGIAVRDTVPWQTVTLGPNVEFIPIARIRYPSRVPMRLKCLFSFFRMRQRILTSGIDLLYVHSPETALPFLSNSAGIPVIFHQHGSGNPMDRSKFGWGRNRLFKGLFNAFTGMIHRQADWTIAIDRLCVEQARQHGIANKASLLMNAVDLRFFYPDEGKRIELRQRLSLGDDVRVLLFVGRLEQVKRVDLAVASLQYLRESLKRFHLIIAGDGTQRSTLEELVKVHGLGNVTFLGHVQHIELPALYNMADVLLLPSEMEGIPMVILEALACGTPVVASKVGGVPDVIQDGVNGMTLVDISPEPFAKAIELVVSSRFQRPAVAATVDQFSVDRFVAALGDIINTLFERRRGKE